MSVDMSELHPTTMHGGTIENDVAGPFLNQINDVDESDAVFHFDVSLSDSLGQRIDSAHAKALADTGANVLVVSNAVADNWRALGGILEEETVIPIPIRLGSKRVVALQPLVSRIRVNLRLRLADYDLHADSVWVWIWPELREEMILSFGFLKRHELLLYMQTHIAPVSHAPEEQLLTDMQSMNPLAEEFTDSLVHALRLK